MNELKDQFLRRAVGGLEELSARIKNAGRIDDGLSKEAFRLLHTIKGAAQTFGLAQAAAFAHDLEDHVSSSADSQTLLEGFLHLISLLENDNKTADFAGKLNARKNEAAGSVFISQIARETFKQFSDLERKTLFSATAGNFVVACIEAGFDLPTFTADFKALKEKLNNVGETIATLPGENREGKIFFKFYIAAQSRAIEELTGEAGCSVTRFDLPASSDACALLSQVGNHALDLAEKSGKEVYVIISAGETALPVRRETVFDILLHLVRNAVDHAFSSRGTIYIDQCIKDSGLLITVEDDGRGLDPEMIRSKALEKGLIAGDASLAPEEVISLIFSRGFSTSETVSEISGRGVGLDAVKSITERAGGTIRVTSEKEKGTVFEIYLPA